MGWGWQRVAVAGTSMLPTLAPGDWLVVRRTSALRVDDLAVVRRPDRPALVVVKRVVAGPGEARGGRALAPGEWWLEGDNPAASDDSREFGPVRADHVLGRVAFRYWPWRFRGRVG